MRLDPRAPCLPSSALVVLTASLLTTFAACEQNRIRDPLDTHLQLWQPGESYYYGAYAVTDAFAEVLDVTPSAESWFSGDRGMVYTFADKADEIRETLNERMAVMPAEAFEDVLRPAFKQDEWKLIIAGAVLGLVAGVLQLALLFGDLVLQ